MRDIDFEELDKAVNRYLDGGSVEAPAPKKEVEVPKDILTEEPVEKVMGEIGSPKIVFSRRQPIDAGNFHAELISRKKTPEILNPEESKAEETEKPELISVKIKKEGREIMDNFKESSKHEPSKKHDVINDELRTKCEEPVLDVLFEGDLSNRETEQPKNKSVEEKSEADVEPVKISPRPVFVREIVIPERPGVHKIEEKEELRFFGVKEKEEEKIEISTEEKVDVEIEKPATEDLITEVPQISEESKTEEVVNISVKIDEDRPVAEEKPAEVSTKVISEKITSEELSEVKTPFVSNPKIEKRPLGSPLNSQPLNLDIKPADRARQIKKAKFENPTPTTPMLSRDEYSSPVVPKKKKSGWGVVFAILFILIVCGAGAGLAWAYFNGGLTGFFK